MKALGALIVTSSVNVDIIIVIVIVDVGVTIITYILSISMDHHVEQSVER